MAEPYKGNSQVANPNFYGMIANVDHNMGILRRRLAELGLSENTILIFMTDNGTSAGAKFKGLNSEARIGYNAGMRGKKSSVYDGGHRVPFFIHWPEGGLTGGRDIPTLAAHIDVLPTLADLCGIPVPSGFDPDGLSLKPLLEGSSEPWPREHHVVQYHGGPFGNAMPPRPLAYSVVLTERWRLVNSDGQALYDIQVDPAQREDVSARYPEVVKRLLGLYEPFWERVSPRMTPVRIDLGNPDQRRTRPLFAGLVFGKGKSAVELQGDWQAAAGDRPLDGGCQTGRPVPADAAPMAGGGGETGRRGAGEGGDCRSADGTCGEAGEHGGGV